MRYTAGTDIGLKREKNEDNFYAKVYDENNALFVVADGIGGYSSGEVASKVAVNEIKDKVELNLDKIIKMNENEIKEFFRNLVIKANEKLYNLQISNPKYKGMGTTIVIASKINGKIYYTSAGDSRVYYIGDKIEEIKQITVDDTYVNALLKQNLIKKCDIENHPQRHVLTKALGVFSKIDVEVKMLDNNKGYLVLCTDGLTNMVTNEDILNTVKNTNFMLLSDTLIDMANRNGGIDNVTVVVVEI